MHLTFCRWNDANLTKQARLQGSICQIRILKVCTRDWELVPERFHAAWWRCTSSDCRKASKEATCTEVSTGTHNVCLESKIQYKIEFSVQWMFILFTRDFFWWQGPYDGFVNFYEGRSDWLGASVRFPWEKCSVLRWGPKWKSWTDIVPKFVFQEGVSYFQFLGCCEWYRWYLPKMPYLIQVFMGRIWSISSWINSRDSSIIMMWWIGALWWLTILGISPISRTFRRKNLPTLTTNTWILIGWLMPYFLRLLVPNPDTVRFSYIMERWNPYQYHNLAATDEPWVAKAINWKWIRILGVHLAFLLPESLNRLAVQTAFASIKACTW